MADKEEDASENKGVSGVWNATLGRRDDRGNNVAALAAGYSLGNVFCRGDGEAFGALLFISGVLTAGATVGLEIYESFNWEASNDSAIVAPLTAENTQSGYSSITGDKTYILVRNNDTWRIYQKESGSEAGYVFDPIAALEIVNQVTSRLQQASSMTATPEALTQGTLSALPRDVRFDEISTPYGRLQGDRQYVSRFIEGQQSNAVAGEGIHARYERLHGIWAQAQREILNGRYGFTQQELSAIEAPDRLFDGALSKAGYTSGGLLALWLLGSIGFGVGEAISTTKPAQRRRKQKPA